MSDGELDETLLLGPAFMDSLREIVTRAEPDTIAVFALTGTRERGLAVSVSSTKSHPETVQLLLAALLDEAAHEVIETFGDREESEGEG